jgi:hypothetical protein
MPQVLLLTLLLDGPALNAIGSLLHVQQADNLPATWLLLQLALHAEAPPSPTCPAAAAAAPAAFSAALTESLVCFRKSARTSLAAAENAAAFASADTSSDILNQSCCSATYDR